MATKNRILTTKRNEVNTLAKMFGVTRGTVYNVLNCVTESEKGDRIRKAALNRGAIELKQ